MSSKRKSKKTRISSPGPRHKKTKKKAVNGRSKGGRGERAVAKLFSEWWGADFARTPLSGGFHTRKFREDWNAQGDLVTPDETFPFSVECKWQEGWTLDHLLTAPKSDLWAWWEQALEQTPEGKIPLLVFKRNNMPWYFMTYKAYENKVNGFCVTAYVPKVYDQVIVGLLEDILSGEKEIWLRK